MSAHKITTVVFDLGNVVVNWKPAPFIETLLGCSPEYARDLSGRIFNEYFDREVNGGHITQKEYLAELAEEYPEEKETLKTVLEASDRILTEREGVEEVFTKLKEAGYSLLYLSNTNASNLSYIEETCTAFRLLEGGVASHLCRLTKPGEEIFRYFLSKFGKTAEECLFIDDTAVNTDTAGRLGFHTVTLTEKKDLAAEIGRILNAEDA